MSCPRWQWGSQPWPPMEAPAALPSPPQNAPPPQGPPVHGALQPLLQGIRCPGVNSTLLRGVRPQRGLERGAPGRGSGPRQRAGTEGGSA